MSDIGTRRLRLTIWVLLAILVVMLALPVFASGRDNIDIDIDTDTVVGVETTVNGGDMIGGDTNVSTGGNRSFALVNSLGDVDIAGCLGSTQWSTPIYSRQKLVLNWPCMAEFYLRNGKFELAAIALCNTEILDEFDSEADCEAAHDFTPVNSDHDVHTRSDEFELAHAQQEEEIEYLREESASIVNQLEALTEQLESAPVTVSLQLQTQIQRQEGEYERRRARALEAYNKALEESRE